MCLILFAHGVHPVYRLVVAANRDEFYARPTAPAGWWEDAPEVLAGRDLRSGGTWMGITHGGRFAAVTNFRDPGAEQSQAPSRGHLVSEFLRSEAPPGEYLDLLVARAAQFNGFNLLVGDTDGIWYFGNRSGGPVELNAGIYGLSNHLLNTPWPKVERGRQALRDLLSITGEPLTQALLQTLADVEPPPDQHLPDTGVGREWERALASPFITTPEYGTRSSTVLLVGRDEDEEVMLVERTVVPGRSKQPETRYRFRIQE